MLEPRSFLRAMAAGGCDAERCWYRLWLLWCRYGEVCAGAVKSGPGCSGPKPVCSTSRMDAGSDPTNTVSPRRPEGESGCPGEWIC